MCAKVKFWNAIALVSEPIMKPNIRAALALIVGIIAMSSAAIMIKWALISGVPASVVAAYRLTIASVVVSIPIFYRQGWKEYAKIPTRIKGLLAVSGILLALHFATWISSLGLTSVVSSVVLVATTPLWAGILGPFVLQEPTAATGFLGIGVAVLGTGMIGYSDSRMQTSEAVWGSLLALAGAVFAAGYLLAGRKVRSEVPFVTYVWAVYTTAAIILVGLAILGGNSLWGYEPSAMWLMIGLGLVPQLIGHTATNFAVRNMSATFVGVSILGEPIGASILAVALLHETLHPLQLAGAVLILLGILITAAAENKNSRRHDAPAGQAETSG